MGILRADRVSGLGGANAINGSVFFPYKTSGGYFHSHMEIMSDDFAIGTGNFTTECFYYQDGAGGHTDSGGNVVVLTGNKSGTNGIWLSHRNDGKFQANIHYASGSWNLQITSSNAFNVQQWYHVALVRSGSSVKLYVDGVQEASGTSSSDLTTSMSNGAWIGSQGNTTNPASLGSRGINGYVSNVRFSNEALYTAAFTAPTTRLEKLSSTLLLCCQSPGNIFKEETGKTITLYQKETESGSPKVSRFAPDKGEDHGTTFADNTKFDTLSYMVPPGGTTTQSNRGRAVLAGGYTTVSPGNGTKTIEYLQIQSGGIVKDFGDLSEDRKYSAGLASATRGVIGGSDGTPSWATGTMEYVTIATTSNTTSFGNMTNTAGMVSAHSNNTRGLFFSVWDSSPSSASHKRHIDYITIAAASTAQDFGELTVQRPEAGGFGSSTRGIAAGGYDALSPFNAQDTIDYVTIATTGNATDFGNLTVARQGPGSASSSTRGIIAGGYVGPNSYTNHIDYVTIATTGDATDFGDTVTGRNGIFVGNCSNQINGVFAGGTTANGVFTNTIDYVTIATTGNAIDFGDLTSATPFGSALTDCHGGIS